LRVDHDPLGYDFCVRRLIFPFVHGHLPYARFKNFALSIAVADGMVVLPLSRRDRERFNQVLLHREFS